MYDFLIIGGGIAGLSAGARLSHLGKVCVLEGEGALGYHASGRSAAMFEETYGLPSTIALNKASRSYLADANGGVLSPRGLMLIGCAGEDEQFEADLKNMQMDERPARDVAELVPLIDPAKVARIGHRADAWDIDTDLLLQNFAREIRGNGGVIRTNARVTQISRTETGWTARADEDYAGRLIFNAAGAWADLVADLAGVAPIGFVPCRRSMARVEVPGGHDPAAWPMMFGTGERWYAKPDAGALIISPADETPVEPHDAWADDMDLAEGVAHFEEVSRAPVTRMIGNWAGLRTFAPDRSLVLGPEPSEPTYFWVAGQGGYGFQTSAAASQFLADQVAGRSSDLATEVQDQLTPARLRG